MQMQQKPILEYSSPPGERTRGLASIWIAAAIMAFTAVVVVWGDPFQSRGNEKPFLISVVAGVLGVFVGLRDRARCKPSKAPMIGILLNALAILAASFFLPYI